MLTQMYSTSAQRPSLHRTQKNKATEFHLGILKAKLAKLKAEVISGGKSGGGGKPGDGFDVTKSGGELRRETTQYLNKAYVSHCFNRDF
jgi:hypothetical protein